MKFLNRMSELCLLPTPNWFTARPIDILANSTNNNDNDGIVALSVINSIYLTDFTFKIYYGCIKEAHSKRISCLAFKKVLNKGFKFFFCQLLLMPLFWFLVLKTLMLKFGM